MCLCSCTPCEGTHAQVTSQGGGGRLWDLLAWASGYVGLGSFFCPFSNPSYFRPLVNREWKNGGNSSYNGTPFLHSLLSKGTVSTSYPGTRGMLSAHSLDCRNSQGFVQTEDRQKLFCGLTITTTTTTTTTSISTTTTTTTTTTNSGTLVC